MCVYLVVCTWVRVEDPCKGNAIKRKGDEKKSLFVIRLRCQSSIRSIHNNAILHDRKRPCIPIFKIGIGCLTRRRLRCLKVAE